MVYNGYMWKRIWQIKNLKYIVAFLVPAVFVMFMRSGLDNDSWFVLAEGRYLVGNGIHYTDVLTMHEGLNVVVQNYAFAAVFYLIYSAFGVVGLYVMMLVLNFVICFLLYKICMLISKKNVNLSLLIMMVTDLFLGLSFVTTRPQMVSYISLLCLIYVLELFIKTSKTKYLWWGPLISLVEINFHASYWWLLFCVLAVYVLDSVKKPKLHLQGYKTRPLIIISLVALLVGLINPYGIKMITYVLTSYGASEITGLVSEMHPFDLNGVVNVILYLVLVVVAIMYVYGNKKDAKMRYILMFFGFLALGINTVKGMSQFILVMFFPLALMYRNVRIEKVVETKIGRDAIVFWAGVITTCVFIVSGAYIIPNVKNGPSDGMMQAMDAIEESSGGESARVYVGYDHGGYVEFRGYKSYLDPRAEVFLEKNNGKENILVEWENMVNREMPLDEFLEKYNFDYLVVAEWQEKPLYELEDERYGVIYDNEEEKIRVLKRAY